MTHVSMFRNLMSLLGIILAIPILFLIGLAIRLPTSRSGMIYLLGLLLIIIGLILAPRTNRFYFVVLVGVVVVILMAGTRIFLAQRNQKIQLIDLSQERSTSWLNSLIDEQDMVIFGEMIFHWIGGDSQMEHDGVASALSAVYSQMRQEGPFSSPIAGTYLGLQSSKHFDATVIDPDSPPSFGVIFLHGYMGNVSVQCWVLAQTIRELGGITVCPSTEWRGRWWLPEGQAILHSTFDYLRERGIQRIYLGGFSNGGFSMGRLAEQLKQEEGLSGLFFIDGFDNGADIRGMGLPVFILQGTNDERVPASYARQFAVDVGPLGTYVEINADHFLIMKQPELVQTEFARWLKRMENR